MKEPKQTYLSFDEWVLKNRYLIINPPAEYAEQPRLDAPASTIQVPYKFGENLDEILGKLGKRAEKLGKKLGKNRIAILRLIYSNPFVSSVEMANSIGISTTAIDNNIRQMRNVFIKRIGPNNGGHWEIIMED